MLDLEPFTATICWYGVTTVDGRVVREGAIAAPRLPLPLLVMGATAPIGTIEFVEDGWDEGHSTLVVMGSADPSGLPRDENGDPFYGVAMELSGMEATYEDDLMIVTSARLLSVVIVMEPAYPRAVLRFDS